MAQSDDAPAGDSSSGSAEGSSSRQTDDKTKTLPGHSVGSSTQPDPVSSSSSGNAPSKGPTNESSDPDDNAKSRIEASSSERTQSLKAARDAALKQSPPQTSPSSSQNLNFPPDSAFSKPNTYPPSDLYPPAPPVPSIVQHQSRDRSGLIIGLQRLGYILSLILGSSAILGLFWSTFILPLLHSSFSARQVLLEQQVPRFGALLNGLKALRVSPLFPIADTTETIEEGQESRMGDRKRIDAVEHKSGIEEISTSESSKSERSQSQRRLIEGTPTKGDNLAMPLLPLDDLSSLSTSLRSLSGAITSTSTTRVSLLSTLETYTSQLHREVYLRTDHSSAFSVGLGSLSQNLASASGSKGSAGLAKNASSEWDDVRKEIRAIKGLLLGRRNFMPTSVQS